MCSELQDYYNMMTTGCWAHPDPDKCPCGGRGWVLSDLDTWHECPIHKGHRHPEDEIPGPVELTWNERMVLRSLYTAKALPGTNRGGCFTWNLGTVISNLGTLDLVEWREVPHRDGEIIAQLTERGVKSYLKGVRLGVQTP